ncbi:hypothetical protein IGJ18_001262 [Enterococcus sp. AZ078]|uniref:hypothetical protein n=1 Tax=Enterococcus sp. AZ078 TaxID=2774710 RepID=UPI003F2243E6
MEKLNKKNGEKVSVQSKNQRGIFYRLKDRLKLNKKNGKKVIVQAEDQPSLAYELTNKYKLEKNKSDDMKALVALEKDLSKYDPATIEGILFYLPLTPEKKNLFQPRNRIVRPEDQQSHAYRLTNKYELKMERTNPEKFAKLGRELSRYDPATIEGILLHLPLIPEEKDLLQPRNRIVQPEDQFELADRLIDKYKLKNKHTNLKTMAALGKDLSRYDPDSTEGILLHLPLIPEEKKQLQPRNRIVQPEDQLELAYRITKKYKLKHQHTNLKTFVALGKDLSRYDPDSTEGILLHLPLIPEEKNLLQPRNRIVKPEDRLELADRLTVKYNLKMERTDPVTFAKLDRELSKYDSDSTAGILLHLPLIPEEKDLLQPRNRIVKPENQPNLAYRLTKKYKLKNQHTNVKTLVALGKELSKYDPNSTAGILLLLPLNPEEKKLLQPRNRIAQPKDQPALAYELTEEKKQSTNMETLVALDKDLSKDDPTSSEGNISNLPLNPEEKKLLQPSNRIAQPEDQPALAYELTEEKKQSTNMETLVTLDKDLSKDDPTSSGGNISNRPLNPEEKKLLQPSNRIAQPEDQPALAYELTEEKKQSTNMETLVTLDKDLSKDDPTSSGGNISNRPLNPEEKKLLQPSNRIAQPDDQPALAYELTEEKKQSTNMETLAALDKDLSKDDPTSSEGNISNLPLNPEEKKLLQPSNKIAQPDDQPALAYELTEEKKQSTNMETLAALDKDLSKDDPTSTEGNISNRPLNPEEKNLLQQRTIEMESIDRTFFIDYLNEQHNLNSNTPLSEKTKAALIEDLDKFYYLPLKPSTCYNFISDLHIINRDDVYELLNDQIPKVNELITQVINNATLGITNKYQLLENQSVPKEKLEAIATEILDLNLGEEQEREVIAKLEISKEDRATLEEIYREKRDLLQTQESQKDAEIKAATIAITNTYELSVEKTTPQEKLKAIANELINRNLSTLQEHEIIYLLEIETKDRDTLRTIYKELKKIQENQKDANVKAVTIAFKNIYKLSEDQPNSQNNLKAIAKTIVDLDLSDEQKREVILELEIPKKDKDTLGTIYKELKIIQESQKDANIKAITIAITNIYKLSEDQSNSQNNLKAIAKTIWALDLSDEQKREVILELEIPKKDKDTLQKMYSNKLEKKLQKLHWERVSIATAISSKYLLSIEKTTPQEKLKGIANELIDLNLSKAQEKEKEIIHLLEIETEDRDTLGTIYKELKKIQVIKKVATLAITTKYELSEDQSNSPEKLNKTAKKIANLDLTDEQKREVILELKIPEKDQDTLLSIYEEQKKAANIAIIKKYQPNAQYDLKEIAKHIANERRNNVKKKSTESEQLFQQNVHAVATTITNKHQLSEKRPANPNKLHRIANEVVNLNLNIDQKLELMRTLALTQADKDKLRNICSNSVINDKIVSLLAEEIKVAYQLSENKTISPKDLHNIAITIENSSLDKKYMDTVSNALVMTREDKETLRDMIRERAKQQTEKKQENEADIKINGKTIAEVLDDNALLLSRAMDTALELKENEKVKPEILSMMAEFIGSRKLNEINRRNIPYMLTLTKEDKEELSEIINEKTTLLNKELEISQEPAKMNLSSTLSQGLNNLDSNPKDPLQTSPKPNLRTLLNQSENTPGLEPNTSPKPGTLPKAPARINLLNVVVQNKIVSLLAETIKVNYQLSENKTTSPKDLHEIAITIENSYLDEKYMDTLSDNLVMRIEEKEALRDIIRERAKQQTDKKQENEADIKINGKTIAEVVDDNALLLSRAMNTALALKENQKVEPKMLSTMAEFIGSRKLNEINRRNIPYMLTLTNEDKKELNEIINGKTTLLSKLPELDRTNPNPIDQVPLPLNQRLSNRGSEQNTLPKPNKNIKQMNSLSQGSAEVSR